MSHLSNLLNDRKDSIPYRAKIAKEVGSVTGAILLQQVSYWWSCSGNKPFYKFKEPCASKGYKEGDSWCEELGFSRSEFDTAFTKIGSKIKRADLREMTLDDPFVWAYTDMSRQTYYVFNGLLFEQLLRAIYVKRESPFTKSDNPTLYKPESSVIKSGIPTLPITENTTENTIRESTPAIAALPNLKKVTTDISDSNETVQPSAPEDEAQAFVERCSAPRNDFNPFGASTLVKFEGGSENDYESIYKRIADALNNGTDWKGVAGLARCTMSGDQFKEELQAWIRHYLNKPHLYKKPVQSLRGGPISFVNWLRKPWAQEKYNPTVKAQQTQARRSGPVRRTISTSAA